MLKSFVWFDSDYAEYADCAGRDFTFESLKNDFSAFSFEGANRHSANSANPAKFRMELHFNKSRSRHEGSLDEEGVEE